MHRARADSATVRAHRRVADPHANTNSNGALAHLMTTPSPTRRWSQICRSVLVVALPAFSIVAVAACSGTTPASSITDSGASPAPTSTSPGTVPDDNGMTPPEPPPIEESDAGMDPATGEPDASTGSQGGGDSGGPQPTPTGTDAGARDSGGGGGKDAGSPVPTGDAGTGCPAGSQGESEPNNTMAAANAIIPGVICGAVGGTGDGDDYMKFSFSVNQKFTFEWSSPTAARLTITAEQKGQEVTLHAKATGAERATYTITIGIK
jgi:hypothetical protein